MKKVMAENGEFTSWDVGKKKSDQIADVVIAAEFKKTRRASRLLGSARPIQNPVKGYKMSISEVTDLMIRHMSERGGARMTEQSNEPQSLGVSRSEFDQHKTMIDQRFDHLEKINTIQYESIQKDMRHGFELIANRIGSLEDKIVASEKDTAIKFDSLQVQIGSFQRENESKFESLQGQIGSFQRETESKFDTALESTNTKFDSFENKITLKMNEQKTEILNAVRTERKEDHKYIFSTLMTIMGVGFGALSILVAIALAVLTIVFT